VSVMFSDSERDGASALSDVHLPTFAGDAVDPGGLYAQGVFHWREIVLYLFGRYGDAIPPP
jgi:hypothetical protein